MTSRACRRKFGGPACRNASPPGSPSASEIAARYRRAYTLPELAQPCLTRRATIVPQSSQIRLHRQLVVAINGSAVDPIILDLAATIGKRDRTHVAVVYVVEVGLQSPVDADLPDELERGERILVAAEKTARERGLRATYDVLQARSVGAAIVDEA